MTRPPLLIRFAMSAALCASPLSAAADAWACGFTAECSVTEGCATAGFTARLIAADHAGELFLSTAMGDTPVMRLSATDALPASYAGASRVGAAELLTIAADGTATLSVHLFDGAASAITYFGTCEELR